MLFFPFQMALKRLHSFITTSVFESYVGGRFAANLVRGAAKVCCYWFQAKGYFSKEDHSDLKVCVSLIKR